jgi:hypothetical protein
MYDPSITLIFTSSCNRRLSHIQRTATLLWSQFSHEGWGTWFLFTDAAWRHSPGRWLTMVILWNTHTCREMWGFHGSWRILSPAISCCAVWWISTTILGEPPASLRARLALIPWRWQEASPEQWWLPTRLHAITSLSTVALKYMLLQGPNFCSWVTDAQCSEHRLTGCAGRFWECLTNIVTIFDL